MMVDVSHASDATVKDALRASQAPLIGSHSSCRAVTPHRRNLPDALLRAIAARGGVVLLNFAYVDAETEAAADAYRAEHRAALEALREPGLGLLAQQRRVHAFLVAHPPPRPPLESLLRHLDHALAVAGADAVGLGTDCDGVPALPVGLDDAAALPALTRALLARGHSPRTVQKLLDENLLRVMEEVERVAGRLRSRA